jgi:competence protein CoiA
MIWAIKNNERIKATPGSSASCPICKNEVVAKCGLINEWHWAHVTLEDCDNWYEPESEWHIKWKSNYPENQQEVVMKNHRADIKSKNGVIIELQNGHISPNHIEEREKFYDRMIWILNGETIGKNLFLKKKWIHKKNINFNFKWKYPHKSFFYAHKPICFDFEKDIEKYELKKEILNKEINKIYEEMGKMLYRLDRLKHHIVSVRDFSYSNYNSKIIFNEIGEEEWFFYSEKDNFLHPNNYHVQNYINYLRRNGNLTINETIFIHRLEFLKNQAYEKNKKYRIFHAITEKYEGNAIFLVQKIYKKTPCYGWGTMITKEKFMKMFP